MREREKRIDRGEIEITEEGGIKGEGKMTEREEASESKEGRERGGDKGSGRGRGLIFLTFLPQI